jgi:outer membrane protein TolC
MSRIEIKKDGEDIFRYNSQSIILPIIRIGITLYCLSCAAFFSNRHFISYAAEPSSEPSPVINSHSEKDLSLGKEQSEIVEEYLKKAQSCFEEGRYHEAVRFWNDVLASDPANQDAKNGIELAGKKIAKIKDFFGKDVFIEQEMSMLSLENCLKIAEESCLLFQIAEEQVNLAKIKIWEARRAFLPSLALSWAETKGTQAGGKTQGIEYGVEAKQPVFRSGESLYTLAQSKVDLNIAEENYDKIKLELYFEVAEAYYSLVKAKRFLNYTKTLYEDSKPFYEMAKKKHENKLVPDIEYLDTESKFNQIYYKNISTENDFEIAKLALEQKLNIERTGSIDVMGDIPPKNIDKDVNTCLFYAIENRPDLKMGELTLKSADYGKKIAEAKEGPKIDLAGQYKRASEVYRQSFLDNSHRGVDPHRKWYAGFEVNWPFLGSTGTYSLYKRKDPATLSTYYGASESKGTSLRLGILDNLKQFSDKQEAEISYARAKDELNEMRKKAIKEVKDAFYAYKKASIQLESATLQREFSEKEIEIIKVKHSLGEANLSELFDSLIRLLAANETFFEAEKDLNVSIAALNKAIGLRDYF